ncbi:ABC1 kinase family protein [Alicyclobacillus sp. ALC3]|uniref:ABC1 kinase family protein n=1 Tax=Alicyclobacillus sp. ALC3 TaxID=2796143 RepID=UPI0023781E75|nr:AarF/UbiB family protein [Alicyclobacillus sp. ALC3]WDL96288.1 AarF/ABC1/UbiB kinase family protein [Alicyclobacillus sp. ALC3]
MSSALPVGRPDADLTEARRELTKLRAGITRGKRLRSTVQVMTKHGVGHLLTHKSKDEEQRERQLGKRLRAAFEELGPTFIKLGQVLMTRQELLPDALTAELDQLLNEVPPLPFVYMSVYLEDELPNAMSTFNWIHPTPIGSASLAQVYQAELADGRLCAVKIVRPLVDKVFQADIANLRRLVKQIQRWLPPEMQASLDLGALVDDYFSSAMSELDMKTEAQVMRQHQEIADEFGTLRVPQVYEATDHVLIMEYVDGWNLKEFPVDFFTFEERLERMTDLAHYYVKTFLDGFYHADPHGANIMVDRRTKECVVLDWGMTGRMDAVHTEAIFRMLMHVRVNQGEDAAEVFLDLYQPTKYTNTVKLKDDLRSTLIHYVDSSQASQYNWGNLTLTTIQIAVKNHCRVPGGLALWAKGFSAAEGTARWLCPEISYHDLVEIYDVKIVRSWLSRRFNYRANASLLAESAKLLTTAPRRINKILELIAWNNLQVGVEGKLAETTARTLHRLVNRASLAFLSGTLFVGSTMLFAFASKTTHAGFLTAIGSTGLTASAVLLLMVLFGAWRSRRAQG